MATRGMRIDHPAVASLNNTYERALVSMHKMPRIWLDYLQLLVEQKLVRATLTHPCTHTYTHTHTHIDTHRHTHRHTHTNTHIHIHEIR